MIRYKVSETALLAAIENHKSGWLTRAKQKTKEVKAKGRVDKKDGIWSEIKSVFASLQHYKCIYCEKPLPQEDNAGKTSTGKGAVEYDVEHFRPKNAVKPWPSAKLKEKRQITYDAKLSMGEAAGYLRLAFEPTNYALSCKTCNSGHKGNGFPIAGKTKKSATRRRALDAVEKPCLILPFGDDADDPEQILGWDGPLPVPKTKVGHKNLRAKVCIDFFALDTRMDLFQYRCMQICVLWPVLQKHKKARGAKKTRLAGELRECASDKTPFAACVRAYIALFKGDPARAKQLYDHCCKYLVSRDPAIFS